MPAVPTLPALLLAQSRPLQGQISERVGERGQAGVAPDQRATHKHALAGEALRRLRPRLYK